MKTLYYKTFVYVFLTCQLMVVLHALPSQFKFNSYTAEILTRILFSITKVNHMYNFFTDPLKTGKYSYTTNNLILLKSDNQLIQEKVLTRNGSIKSAVHKLNQARVSHIQSLATRDTALYNAVIRSQSLYFISENKEFPLFSVQVLNHDCKALRIGNVFSRVEKVDTIYHNLFSLE